MRMASEGDAYVGTHKTRKQSLPFLSSPSHTNDNLNHSTYPSKLALHTRPSAPCVNPQTQPRCPDIVTVTLPPASTLMSPLSVPQTSEPSGRAMSDWIHDSPSLGSTETQRHNSSPAVPLPAPARSATQTRTVLSSDPLANTPGQRPGSGARQYTPPVCPANRREREGEGERGGRGERERMERRGGRYDPRFLTLQNTQACVVDNVPEADSGVHRRASNDAFDADSTQCKDHV